MNNKISIFGNRPIVALALFLFFLLSSCSPSDNLNCMEATPHPRSMDIVDGSLIGLEIIGGSATYSVGDEITLKIVNLSNHSIWFPEDLNLLVMNRPGENTVTFLPVDSFDRLDEWLILDGDPDGDREHIFSFVPVIPFSIGPIELEIFVSGYIFKDGLICEGRYRSSVMITVQS